MSKKVQNDVLGKSDVSHAIRDMIQGYVINFESCMPAKIVVVESEDFGLVKCQPLVKLTYEENGEFKSEDRPEVICKYWSFSLGSDLVYMPVKPKSGMTGWIIGGDRDSLLATIGNNASHWEDNLGPRKSLTRGIHKYQFGLFLPDTFVNNRHLEVGGTEHGLKIVKIPDSASDSIPKEGDDGVDIDNYDDSVHSEWKLDEETTEILVEVGGEGGPDDASILMKKLSEEETTKISISTSDLEEGEEAKLRECYVITSVSESSFTMQKAKVLAYFDDEETKTVKVENNALKITTSSSGGEKKKG